MYKELVLQNKWFSSVHPVNPKGATGTLTFDGVVADAQTVTIGTEVYEFKTSGDAGTGKIKVDVSGGVTAPAAVTALVTAITANSTLVNAVDGEGNIVVVTAKIVGTSGNDITIATTCANASWGEEVTKLANGQFGTPCSQKDVIVRDDNYYYWCEKEGGKSTVSWKMFAPVTF